MPVGRAFSGPARIAIPGRRIVGSERRSGSFFFLSLFFSVESVASLEKARRTGIEACNTFQG